MQRQDQRLTVSNESIGVIRRGLSSNPCQVVGGREGGGGGGGLAKSSRERERGVVETVVSGGDVWIGVVVQVFFDGLVLFDLVFRR